jgi:LPXTG-motif cell wall-anchored protein
VVRRKRSGLKAAFGATAAIALVGCLVGIPSAPAEADALTCTPPAGFTNCVTYSFSGADQTFTVPAAVTTVYAEASGSGGQNTTFAGSGPAGIGGLASGTIDGLVGGTVLTLTVGGTNGFGGGGDGGAGTRGSGGNGGGFSAVWQDRGTNTPFLLAGGGGGAAGANGAIGQKGGNGGGTAGTAGASVTGLRGGGGGTATGGGSATPIGGGTDGGAFQGGDGGAGLDGGGGGGGGLFGGGGGGGQELFTDPDNDGGGGGGSGFLGTVTGGVLTVGGGSLADTDGSILLAWNAPAPVITSPIDGSTAATPPPLTGTAVPGNTVNVSDGGTTVCTTVATGAGAWTCPTPPSFTPGSSHSLIASQTDEPTNPLPRYPASTTVSFSIAAAATADPTTSTISASPTTITADGAATSTITVTLNDTNGNPLTTGGDTVTITPTSGTLSTVTDNGDGTYTATLTAPTTAGTSTISFTVNGTDATDTTTITFTADASTPSGGLAKTGPSDSLALVILGTFAALIGINLLARRRRHTS